MSIEVADMIYLFVSNKMKLKWFYNPIHDMESVWWLFAWTTLNRDIYFIHHTPESGPDTALPPSNPGVMTRSRRKILDEALLQAQIPGNAIEADRDQIVPAGLTQETRVQRVQRVKQQHAFSTTMFIRGHTTSLARNNALRLLGYIDQQVVANNSLHPIVHVLGVHLCTGRDLLADTYTKAEADLARLPANASKVADGLHEQFKALFDDARKYLDSLSARVAVRKLSDEHRKILDAEQREKEELEAAGAAEKARQRAEGAYRLFAAAKGSPKDTPQPSSTRRRKSAGPSDERPSTHYHPLPSVPEDPEIDTGSEPLPGPSTLLPPRTTHAVLPPVSEEGEGATSGSLLAGPSMKRKRVSRDEGEVAAAGPSRPTHAYTRRKVAPSTSAEPSPRKPSRRAPTRAAKAALLPPPPPPPKRKRTTPAASAPAMNRGRPSRARVVETALATDTAHIDEEPEEVPRPSKKRRVEAAAKPDPKPGGRVLRPRKR